VITITAKIATTALNRLLVQFYERVTFTAPISKFKTKIHRRKIP
jgi:hypothetical protein